MDSTNGRPKANTASRPKANTATPSSRPKANIGGRPTANPVKSTTPTARPKASTSSDTASAQKARPSSNASKKARIVAEATASANLANKTKSVPTPKVPVEEPKPTIENKEPQIKEEPKTKEEPKVTPEVNDNDSLDLFVDDNEIEQLEEKKKKKKAGAYEEGDLSNKKKKKKRRLLWLLLLLLLLIIGLVVAFKDILFPPKPIVVVPNGMVLKIKSTGESSIGVQEFIFKPGDTIEFEEALSVFSERYVEYEDGSKDELSPFTLRLRFYIEYEGVEHPELIDRIDYSKSGLFTDYNDWLYYNDVVIPGALPVEIINSIHLSSTSIGNEWQDKAVSLVLEYETICPESLEVLDEAFEYNYPPEWGIIVVEGYNMYK